MDYEQKYKEALERAKEWMAGKYGHYVSDTPQEIAEFIFPELKESEDDRIRKELTDYIKSKFENSCSPTPSKNILGNWIAWLEKQGEQKPVDKVEPKFNLYDWVVTDKGDTVQIGAVNNGYYTLCNGMDFNMSYVDKCWHKWTIKDARDGDVLVASDNSVFIFARVDGYGCIYHIALANDGVLKINPQLTHAWESVRGVKPATKEQHDKLEKAMANAGYKWDADKKELIKL